jgi:hypothetical protein
VRAAYVGAPSAGNADVYVHLYKLTDQYDDQCGALYTHVDFYVWANQPSVFINVGTGGGSGNDVFNSTSVSTSSSGQWFSLDSPIYNYS